MKRFIFASAAALAFTAAPAIADDHMDGEATAYVLTADQQSTYDSWPGDRRSIYDAWPAGAQEYYWTLEPEQEAGWWVLNDAQRVRIYEMNTEQRAQAWTAIAAQMQNSNATSTAARTASSSATTGPRFVRSEVVQTTPADAGPPDGELPICSSDAQDNCINAWEAGKRGPGVNRPLEYWPGRPASEIDGPLPATRDD
ncbi:hypothetical protein [Qipengyuania intermedia]|uniref:hypothetical protein n=1 Tax=Qipengyuania intermedia TaxID=2867244 RepID=UPI001FFD6975|nr:hypothetical protein [Qipengyuania intermedia]